MEFKGTPGPWDWKGAALIGKGQTGAAFDDAILRCLGNMTPEDADALLIAAAPELLAAAQDAMTLLEPERGTYRSTTEIAAIHADLRAAIAKALGHE